MQNSLNKMLESKPLCPMMNGTMCKGAECAWWSRQNKCCVIHVAATAMEYACTCGIQVTVKPVRREHVGLSVFRNSDNERYCPFVEKEPPASTT